MKAAAVRAIDTRVEVVVAFMQNNLERQLALTDLATMVNLSASRLRHLFAAETGMSFKVYLRTLRLARAKQLLEESQLSIDQIALRIGWQDRSHFERRFKRIYGLTPAQHRSSRNYGIRIEKTRETTG